MSSAFDRFSFFFFVLRRVCASPLCFTRQKQHQHAVDTSRSCEEVVIDNWAIIRFASVAAGPPLLFLFFFFLCAPPPLLREGCSMSTPFTHSPPSRLCLVAAERTLAVVCQLRRMLDTLLARKLKSATSIHAQVPLPAFLSHAATMIHCFFFFLFCFFPPAPPHSFLPCTHPPLQSAGSVELAPGVQRQGTKIAVPDFLEGIREKDTQPLDCSTEDMSQKLAEFLEVSVDCKLTFASPGDIVDMVFLVALFSSP